MSDNKIVEKTDLKKFPSFQELNDLRENIQKEICNLDDTIIQNSALAFIDAEESSKLYDLHTQITSIIGSHYLDELFYTMDSNLQNHHTDFIEGLHWVINPIDDYDDLFFIQLVEYEWDYEWNDQLQSVIKKVNAIPLDDCLILLSNLRTQILRKLDKAIEYWGITRRKRREVTFKPEDLIKFTNHYLFLQSFEDYDYSMIHTKQLRKYIKSRPFFPAITSDILFHEITRLSEISEANGYQEVDDWLGGIFHRYFIKDNCHTSC